MSAAPKLLPDPSPLRTEGGERYIGQGVSLRDYPTQVEKNVRLIWDRAIGTGCLDETILPISLVDRWLSQLTGMCPRLVQETLYWMEVGPAEARIQLKLEGDIRRLARKPDPTDGDRAALARLRAELADRRAAISGLKDEIKSLTGRMAALLAKPDRTEAERAILVELAVQRAAAWDRFHARTPDATIFRWSGPGFRGDRHIEVLRPLKGKAGGARTPGKGPERGARPARPAATDPPRATVTNVPPIPQTTPEQAAEAAARNAAVISGEEIPEPTPDDLAALDRYEEGRRKRQEAARRDRPAIRLGPAPPGVRPADAAVRALLDAKGLAFRAVPEPDDSS